MGRDNPESAPSILGLTGPIGCGKTTVGDILLGLGALERIDADRVVHTLMSPGTETTEAIRQVFGGDIVDAAGGIDRHRLGTIVFSDGAALSRLEEIVHPAVRRTIRQRIEALRGRDGVVVIDAVKLMQSDLLPLVHAVWVVTCDEDVELHRLIEKRGMEREDACARLAARPSFDDPRVTRVITNSGSLEDLQRQVETAWREFVRESGARQAV